MKCKWHSPILLLLMALLVACGTFPSTVQPVEPMSANWGPPTSIPPSTPMPDATATLRPLPTPISARDELERALATRVHGEPTALCEWQVLGQTPQEIFVWAVCQSITNDSAVSAPAVVHLKTDGHVERVDMPRDGSLYGPDVRSLFPPDIQQRILAHKEDTDTLWARALARRAKLLTPTPSVVSGTNVIVDCAAAYPGLPGCLRHESLVGGRLALVDKRLSPMGLAILDLKDGHVWTVAHSVSLEGGGWSPSGEFLLTTREDGSSSVYRYNGQNTLATDFLPARCFWAPPNAFPGEKDWLAEPSSDGTLWAVTIPDNQRRMVLDYTSLGKDYGDIVRWSRDGWLAWSLNLDQLAESGQWAQALYVQPTGKSVEPAAWRVSDDFRKTYYQIIDWAPGTRLILAAKGMACNSCWTWGVPLVTINADTAKTTELNASMLLTSEAYAWNPTQPGLLAFADGGSRYLHNPSQLTLLDATTGKLNQLTGPDMSVSEPAWAPDGQLLAYAAVRASPNASGDGAALERLLNGRAIYIADPQSGNTRQLTRPPDDAVDGWPQWSADGKQLLYTRQHDDVTDVRVVTLDGSHDELLVTGLARPTCDYGGCGWSRLLAYYPGSEAKR